MLLILCFIYLYFNFKIGYWLVLVLVNLFFIWVIYRLVSKYEYLAEKFGDEKLSNSSPLKLARYWYGIAAILFIFKQVYIIGYALKLPDWDPVFMRLDFGLFGLNPTQWIYKYQNPILTEFLQLVYVYYYPMIVVFGLELYLWHRYKEFKYTIFILFFSFFVSYIFYLIFPANGPRFHLHDFYAINKELPGVFLTEYIRVFLNFGESIPPGVKNPQDFVQRDAMPSLHTITAFLITYLSWKFRSRSFYFYLPYLFCMIAATIYLRYHYVVDIAGGLIMSVITIIAGMLVYRNKDILTSKNT